jgi:protein O-GlcNAc transferase
VIDTLFAEALEHHEAGRRDAAESAYRSILAVQPLHADSLHLLGLLRAETDDSAAGLTLIRQALALEPRRAAYHNSLGRACLGLGRADEALEAFLTAAALLPERAEIHSNIGTVLLGLGRQAEAICHYRLATRYAPEQAVVWFNLANALAEAGDATEADATYRRTVTLQPDFAEAWANHGRLLLVSSRWAEAEMALTRALGLSPAQPGAWVNLGLLLRDRDAASAASCFRNAVQLNPGSAEAHFNLGCLLAGENRTEAALQSHHAALAADPDFAPARLAACMAHLPVLYGSEADVARSRAAYAAALAALVQSQGSPRLAEAIGSSQPFFLPYQEGDDRALQEAYGRFACRMVAPAVPCRAERSAAGRIRVGIVSGFFCDHTLFKLFLQSWVGELDRSQFEVIGFHTGRTVDAQTAWCAARCDDFVQGLGSPAAWRAAVAERAPHVLLYPEIGMDPIAGHLAAARLAPVQCVAWGQPVTSGMPTMDYFLSADAMEPSGAEADYAEELVRLPGIGTCYQPDTRAVRRLCRADLGMDDAVPVFWSGQALYKYLPRYDALYPRIAAAVGRCQFVFVGFAKSARVTEAFRARMTACFAAAGLDAGEYILVLPALSQADYIDAVSLVDVVLDTPGWSGGKSTLDCLAVDPAIVTMPGRHMRGRHTAAILQKIGCGETVVASVDDYVAMAARLAVDAPWREAVQRKVAAGKHSVYADVSVIRALEAFLARTGIPA